MRAEPHGSPTMSKITKTGLILGLIAFAGWYAITARFQTRRLGNTTYILTDTWRSQSWFGNGGYLTPLSPESLQTFDARLRAEKLDRDLSALIEAVPPSDE